MTIFIDKKMLKNNLKNFFFGKTRVTFFTGPKKNRFYPGTRPGLGVGDIRDLGTVKGWSMDGQGTVYKYGQK